MPFPTQRVNIDFSIWIHANFDGSQFLSRSPFCSDLLNLYTRSHPVRQKLTSSFESMYCYESKLMSRSPLCSDLLNFYTVFHPAHQKLTSWFESMHFYGSKLMSRVPFCRDLLNFYTVSHPERQKLTSCTARKRSISFLSLRIVMNRCWCQKLAFSCESNQVLRFRQLSKLSQSSQWLWAPRCSPLCTVSTWPWMVWNRTYKLKGGHAFLGFKLGGPGKPDLQIISQAS